MAGRENMKTIHITGKGTMDRKEGGPGKGNWLEGWWRGRVFRQTDNEIGEDGHIGFMAVR